MADLPVLTDDLHDAVKASQVGHFRNRETHVVGHDDSAGIAEDAFERLDRFRFLSAVHCGLRYSV